MELSWEMIAAGVAIAAGAWSHLQSIIGWFRHLVIRDVQCDTDTGELVLGYLLRDKSSVKQATPAYLSMNMFVKSVNKVQRITWHNPMHSGAQMLWRGWVPLRFECRDKDAPTNLEVLCSYVRGTLDWERLLVDAAIWESSQGRDVQTSATASTESRHSVTYHYGKTLGSEIAEQREKEKKSSRPSSSRWNEGFAGNRLLRWDPADLGRARATAMHSLALMPEIAAALDEIRMWRKKKKWFQEHLLPWRRGYMFVGQPGSGKTSMAREVALEFDWPVHVMDLASMSNEDLRDAWNDAVKESPCMIVLEDIDGVFRGRENIAKTGGMMSSGGLTYDALLNCIDGVERADGVLLVVTTNHPDTVDPAMMRAGRVDRVVTFESLDLPRRIQLARRILGDGEDAERIAIEAGEVPAARFVEMCCRIALEKVFDGGPYR